MVLKIRVYVTTGYVGCSRDDVLNIEVDDSATAEEIEEEKRMAAEEWMHEQIEWGWSNEE